jgi:hypothetical protein
MPLHAEVPLLALLRLMHLGVARAPCILRRRRRGDNRGVDDGPRADGQAPRLQMAIDFLEQGRPQALLFQQMPKLADRRLIRHRLLAQVDADKGAHRRRVVQRLFHGRVGQVEPVLQEVHAEHSLHADRRPAIAGLRVNRFDARTQLAPRHDAVHLGQELRPSRHLRVLLEARAGQRDLRAPHPHPPWWPVTRFISARQAHERETYSEIP